MKLIDKDALVAEIERRRSKNAKNKLNLAASFEDNYLLSFLDTLEVKELDLEKEIKNFTEDLFHKAFDADKSQDDFWNDMAVVIEYAAKHFFELGYDGYNTWWLALDNKREY